MEFLAFLHKELQKLHLADLQNSRKKIVIQSAVSLLQSYLNGSQKTDGVCDHHRVPC